jgi:hypothetical protein
MKALTPSSEKAGLIDVGYIHLVQETERKRIGEGEMKSAIEEQE